MSNETSYSLGDYVANLQRITAATSGYAEIFE